MQLPWGNNASDAESEIMGWACCIARMGDRRLRTMGVREVCESEIVFQRQICKPLEQLVSSFHSDETIPTAEYVINLPAFQMCAFYRWICFTHNYYFVISCVFYLWKQTIPASRFHFMCSTCPLRLAAASGVSQGSAAISSELLEGGRWAMSGRLGYNDDLHHEW